MNAQLSRRRAEIESARSVLDLQLAVNPPDGACKISLTEDERLHAEWESGGRAASFTTLSN